MKKQNQKLSLSKMTISNLNANLNSRVTNGIVGGARSSADTIGGACYTFNNITNCDGGSTPGSGIVSILKK